MTDVSIGIDDTSLVESKTTTTVGHGLWSSNDCQRSRDVPVRDPWAGSIGFMWDDLVNGALGAVVLVDTRRLDDCYDAVDYFEKR